MQNAPIPTENQAMQTDTNDAFRQFLLSHPGRGTLKVQVTTGDGAFPVSQARVEVQHLFGNTPRLLFKNVTDISGITDNMVLPALPASYSQTAATARNSGTEYLVSVYHPSYLPFEMPISVYDGVETILPVALEPYIR
ncbi:MAG: hypothetical protein Q3985_06985 [Eubacteriales bacterium]|nr:hypothetical protein [Eubacteriales bacterium]